MSRKQFSILLVALILGACGTLPASGPYSFDNIASQSAQVIGKVDNTNQDINLEEEELVKKFTLIEVNDTTINAIRKFRKSYNKKTQWPQKNTPHITKVAVGDSIQITIYEQNSGGLFVPKEAGVRPGNFISLPPQIVDRSGFINVPYAGQIKASGKTSNQISESVTAALAELALAPQVVVSFQSRGGSEVSILGDVLTPNRFSLGFNDERVLDIVASAGGPRSPGYETWISLQRNEKEYEVLLDDILLDPAKNIFVKPNDTFYLYREPETFNVYGASSQTGTINFGRRSLSLNEAIGLANGLDDNQADPAEVYVYKEEPIEFVRTLEAKLSMEHAKFDRPSVPVIYKFNLREPSGFFYANKFPIRHQDTVYVANAESVELFKFLRLITVTASTDNAFR